GSSCSITSLTDCIIPSIFSSLTINLSYMALSVLSNDSKSFLLASMMLCRFESNSCMTVSNTLFLSSVFNNFICLLFFNSAFFVLLIMVGDKLGSYFLALHIVQDYIFPFSVGYESWNVLGGSGFGNS